MNKINCIRHFLGEIVNNNRQLRFNISYRFGQMKGEIKKAKRGIKNEDVKSGGDSSTGSGTGGTGN